VQIKVEYANGDSLWSAVAWTHFGSPHSILRQRGKGSPLHLLSPESVESADDYQSGSKQPRSKGSADLIYAHALFKLYELIENQKG
jgi:hypothetical protein